MDTETREEALIREVRNAAKDLARRGLKGAAGDPLPQLMTVGAVSWISDHQPAFRRMVAGIACELCHGTGAEFPGHPRTEKCEACDGKGMASHA